MNQLFERLLKKRGVGEDFLHPKYEDLADPFLMPDMEKGVDRIKKAILAKEKILIYGDYDVDGVTASTVMEEALVLAGVPKSNIYIMLPDRFADGYGMSPKMIGFAKEHEAKLVITVDCGSRNHAIVEELNTLGIDTIVTDHHECEDDLPDAVAVVNPKRKDYVPEPESVRELAGVGVAFKVACGLVKAGLIPEGQEKWLLDLVLLGTVCDSMVLLGENRILGYYGLKVLKKTRRKGLKALFASASIKDINAECVGFMIGPRLNAAGRLETADIALNLLRADSATEAVKLAAKLEELNKKRRTEQTAAAKEIDERGIDDTPVIIETGKWHEGILGIVAGRLVEKYHKPAFVLTEVNGGIYKGSGRSFGDFNLADALAFAGDAIIGGGGHAGAAGVKVAGDKLYEFREKINAYYDSLHLTGQDEYLKHSYDLEVDSLGEIDAELVDSLELLEPYGPGNEDPVFCLKNARIVECTKMGADQNHLRIVVKDETGNRLKLVAFFAPEEWFGVDEEGRYDLLFRPVMNEFQSVRNVEGRIIDITRVL